MQRITVPLSRGSFARTRATSGFSLTELLLAMGLFSMLSVGLVALLSRASDFLTVGSSSAETMDALQTFSSLFADDVSTLYTVPDSETGRPDVRLFSDHVLCDVDADEKPDAQIQRLFFTRLIPNEATAPLTRSAGSKTGATGVLDQSDDVGESTSGSLKATGGLMEVFWTSVPRNLLDPAVMDLYRGYRSPIGGEKSLFPRTYSTDPAAVATERGPVHRAEIVAVARPVLSGVLYFGVRFWSRKTKTWSEDETPRAGGALHTWDSTRGIQPKLPARQRYGGFFLAKDAASTDDPTDDTFPRRMRVTLVVEEVGKNARIGYLDGPMSADQNYLEVADASMMPASDTAHRFVKIGSEWVRFEGFDGNRLTGCKRGARGTQPQAHEGGARVHHGRTVVREFSISTFRDTYQDDLPSDTGR